MGLTYAQAKELGMGHLHPAASGGKSREREILDSLEPAPPTKAVKDGYNKLERAFKEEVLIPAWKAGLILSWGRERYKLRLAGRTWYTPDFSVRTRPDGPRSATSMAFIEIKGFMRDDAAVKLKVAAETYPEHGWLLVQREKRRWVVREVTGRGIGVADIHVNWIHGG